jgi:hypothetical protein
MKTDREVMQQALDALEYIYTETTPEEDALIHAAIVALRARLAEPETCKPALQVERADARRGRWLLDQMRHQNYGPNSGWTLTDIYPGDDAAAAIDAAMEKERGDD